MKRFLFISGLFTLLGLISCSTPTGDSSGPVSGQDLRTLQQVFMSSYYSSSGGSPSGSKALVPFGGQVVTPVATSSDARATVPVYNTGVFTTSSFATLVGLSAGSTISNYPETGQTSVFIVTVQDAPNHIYDIKVTTTFPAGDSRSSYVEEYYVKDLTPGAQGTVDFTSGWGNLSASGTWTIDDPIVQVGSTATPVSAQPWVWNQNYRKKILLTFKDGTTRTETIVSGNNTGDAKFLSFDVNGSLDLSQAFVPATTSDTHVQFSSVVVYETTPSTNPNFWFWSGSQAQTIVGVRYYTEAFNGATLGASTTLTATSISFERTVSVNTTTGGSMAVALQAVVGGSTFNTLAESVLREQTQWPVVSGAPNLNSATVSKKMQTRVINITGQKDFYLQQLNSDFVALSSWASGTKYTPTGAVDSVTATDSSALLFTRNQITTGATGALPLAGTPTDLATAGALAQAYYSILTGASVNSSATSAPAGNVIPAGTSWAFNGQNVQGAAIPNDAQYQLGTIGTVEAWIKISQMTDTMGIVHYGILPNFSDEGYSLQGWNANGQMTMVVDRADGNYDQVLSNTLLGTGNWYYLVGVWDVTGGNHYIKLYINGVLDNTNNNLSYIVPSGSQAASGNASVMVGSQLSSAYNAQWGYFGVNGKIVGVNISKSAVSAATILANYNASKNNTATW